MLKYWCYEKVPLTNINWEKLIKKSQNQVM